MHVKRAPGSVDLDVHFAKVGVRVWPFTLATAASKGLVGAPALTTDPAEIADTFGAASVERNVLICVTSWAWGRDEWFQSAAPMDFNESQLHERTVATSRTLL